MELILRTRKRRQRTGAGFTLIEIVIALGVLSIGLMGMLAAQVLALQGGRTARHTTQATIVARNQVELLQRLAWADPLLTDTTALVGPPPGYTLPFGMQTQVQTVGGPMVEQTYLVRYRVFDQNANLKQIDVVVNWVEPGGRARSYVISTVRHNDP